MLGVRAHRLALLIDGSSSWRDCLRVVEALTGIWGGSTFALVPSDGNSIPKLFWGLIKRHDPDWFAAYRQRGVSDDLAAQLLRHSVTDPFGRFVHTISDQPGFPLTSVQEALRIWPHDTDSVVSLDVHGDDLRRLLILSSAGMIGAHLRQELRSLSVSITERSLEVGAAVGVLGPTRDIWQPFTGPSNRYPFRLTTIGLGAYAGPLGAREHPAIAVCGSTVDDFALFWTLRGLRGGPFVANVFWLPFDMNGSVRIGDQSSPSLEYWQRSAIENTLRDNYKDHSLLLTSATLSPGQLAEISQAIELPCIVVPPQDLDQLVPFVADYWETESTPDVNQTIVQFANGDAMAILATPSPSELSVGHQVRLRWMVEGSIEGVRVPTRPEMTRLIIRPEQGMADTRASRFGFSFNGLSNAIWYGTATRSLMVRPRLRLPTDWEIIDTLAAAADLVITPSDKGTYERQLVQFLGGTLADAGATLRRADTWMLITAFANVNTKALTASQIGTLVRGVRYLDFTAIAAVLGGDRELARTITDAWLDAGLLHRGFLIKCRLCRHFDWYRMAELADRVTCHRCNRVQVYSVASAAAYRLDEIARLAIENHSEVALLGADWLRNTSSGGFHWTTGVDVRRAEDGLTQHPWLEVDLIAIKEGLVYVAEGKSGGSLSSGDRKQLKKYVTLCERLHPDYFLLITGSDTWAPGAAATIAELESKLALTGVRVLALTRDLLVR